ncbi:hypothetical protein F5880DRAFT_205520 [Lentinula raphanica]|nr:hypothetical protein F5880DRAFT_205520 [Lentinula raphanica]
MVYIPFESLSSPSRLSRTTFLAVYLLKAFVGALPTAVQELVPREDIQTFNLRLDRHARAGNNKAEVLCLNVVELGDHICSPDSSSVTSQDPIVESIDLGLIQFASVNDRKDTFCTAQQNAAVSKLLDPWQYTDHIMDSLFLLHSIPGETMKTWEGILIEKNKLPAVSVRAESNETHPQVREVSDRKLRAPCWRFLANAVHSHWQTWLQKSRNQDSRRVLHIRPLPEQSYNDSSSGSYKT